LIKRTGSLPYMHRIVEHNGVLYIGGVIATERKGVGMRSQTEQAVRKIDELLGMHGSSKEKILTVTIFVTDLSLKDEMNEAWQAWLPAEHKPTRATIGVSDLGPDVLIEVTATAAGG
jgi:enamine deaminase RidA (YjgF/YER057c/UK114 family)